MDDSISKKDCTTYGRSGGALQICLKQQGNDILAEERETLLPEQDSGVTGATIVPSVNMAGKYPQKIEEIG